MKIKTFIWDATNLWEKFDAEVNAFIADKQVTSIHTADSQSDEYNFVHTVTIAYLEVGNDERD